MGKEALLAYAMHFVGVPYKWGGDDPLLGLDCSGFVIELLKSQGIVPHHYDANSQTLYNMFRTLSPSKEFGSLAFYGKSNTQISHVAFCLDEKVMLEAGGGDSTTTTPEKAAEKNAYVRMRPITYRKDFIAAYRPRYYWG